MLTKVIPIHPNLAIPRDTSGRLGMRPHGDASVVSDLSAHHDVYRKRIGPLPSGNGSIQQSQTIPATDPAVGRAIAQGVWYATPTRTADGGQVRVLTIDTRQARLGAVFSDGVGGISAQSVANQPGLVAAVNGCFFASGVIGDMQGMSRTYRDESAATADAASLDRTSDRRYYLATTTGGEVLTGRGGLSELHRADIDAFQGGMGVLYTRAQLPNLDQDIRSGAFADRIIFRKDRQTYTIARTFAGVRADGRVMLVTMSDGRNRSQGASFTEAARMMRSLGAVESYILDGGSSTSMVVPGVVQTHTSGGQVKGYLGIYARR